MRRIRSARSEEAAALSALCKRSKAHWGYDSAFMHQSDAALTVTPEAIASGCVLVCEDGDSLLGVISMAPMQEEGVFDLSHLFVEPHAIGTGVGRTLFMAGIELLGERGAKRLLILSDPHAAPFYRRMGATDLGVAPSDAVRDRLLPLLEYGL